MIDLQDNKEPKMTRHELMWGAVLCGLFVAIFLVVWLALYALDNGIVRV